MIRRIMTQEQNKHECISWINENQKRIEMYKLEVDKTSKHLFSTECRMWKTRAREGLHMKCKQLADPKLYHWVCLYDYELECNDKD